MAKHKRIYEAMGADPELHDENDPAYKEEMFETMKAMGWKPERITNDPKCAKEYAEWLAKNP